MTTSKQVTAICDIGHSSSSSNLDVQKNMMRSTVVECTCNNLETIMTTSKQVTAICDIGHSSSSSNLDVQKNMMRSTVVECTCNNLETIMTTSKQVTAICDIGHSSSSSNLDVQKNMMRSTVVPTDTTSDDIGNTGNEVFNINLNQGRSQASQCRMHTTRP